MDITSKIKKVSAILAKYGIDNLALEMELGELFKEKVSHSNFKEDLSKVIMTGGQNFSTLVYIRDSITEKLSMNIGDKDGEAFIDFAYLREKQGEDINVFIRWWLANAGEPKYWSFKRMRTLWPQAFKKVGRNVTPEIDKWDKTFVPPPNKEAL